MTSHEICPSLLQQFAGGPLLHGIVILTLQKHLSCQGRLVRAWDAVVIIPVGVAANVSVKPASFDSTDG
jgi:hypothetical protein